MLLVYEVLQVMSLKVLKEVVKALLKGMEVWKVLKALFPLHPQTQLHRAPHSKLHRAPQSTQSATASSIGSNEPYHEPSS